MMSILCVEADRIRVVPSPANQGGARIIIQYSEPSGELSELEVEVVPPVDKRFRVLPGSLEAISLDAHRAIREALIKEDAP